MLRRLIGALGVLVLVGGTAPSIETEAAEAHCKQLHASLASRVVEFGTPACPIACTAGRVVGDGLLNGTTHFTATFIGPGPDTTFSDAGTFVLTTKHGELTTDSVGLLDLTHGQFFDIGRVSGGTGRFAGATGVLYFFGSAAVVGPFPELAFEGDIRGEVCLPN